MARLLTAAACAAVAAIAVGAPAMAATNFRTIYQGSVAGGYDRSGVFGIAGRDLTGLRFSVVYTTDEGVNASLYQDAEARLIQGGPAEGNDSPTSAVLTIDHHSIAFESALDSASFLSDRANGIEEVSNFTVDYVNENDGMGNSLLREVNIDNAAGALGANVFNGNDFHQPGHYAFAGNGSFNYFQSSSDHVDDHDARGALTATSVTIRLGVPEPSTWSLMIVGFGLAGGGLRRRRVAA